MKSNDYIPAEHGGLDFLTKIKNKETFSERKYFKSVFISGDDMVKEEAEVKKREIDEFNRKIVVADKVFKVNTIISESNGKDKFNNIRQDPVKKTGLRLSTKKVKYLKERQLSATKEV